MCLMAPPMGERSTWAPRACAVPLPAAVVARPALRAMTWWAGCWQAPTTDAALVKHRTPCVCARATRVGQQSLHLTKAGRAG